jgi:hypothetical protein
MRALFRLNLGKEQNMKAEHAYQVAAMVRRIGRNGCMAPSLRVPVTADNRELLRRLRAAEMSAWEQADITARNGLRPGDRRQI